MSLLNNERGSIMYTMILAILLPIVAMTVLFMLSNQIMFDRNSSANHKAEYIAQGAMDALNDYLMAHMDNAYSAFTSWVNAYGSTIQFVDANGSTVQLEYAEYSTNVTGSYFGYQVTATVTNGQHSIKKSIRYKFPDGSIVNGGIYHIINVNSNQALDFVEDTMEMDDGTQVQYNNVIVSPLSGADSQKWKIINVEDVDGELTYKLINMGIGEALDVFAASTSWGATVQTYGDNYGAAQKWQFVDIGGGVYNIYNPNSGKVLDHDHGGNFGSQNVWIWGENDTAPQQWRLDLIETLEEDETLISHATYQLINPYSDLALGVNEFNWYDWADVDVEANNGSSLQKWSVIRNEDGTYKLLNPDTLLYLDVANGHEEFIGTRDIQVTFENDSAAQKWTIVPNGDGTYKLHYRYGEFLEQTMHIQDLSDGGNVQVNSVNNLQAQSWDFMLQNAYHPKRIQ